MSAEFDRFEPMAKPKSVGKKPGFLKSRRIEAFIFLAIFFAFFGFMGSKMGSANLLNTMMNTAFDLLTNTVFFIMGITVLSGALAKLCIEFGVLRLLEYILRPLMRPLYNLPGVCSLAAIITFFSDNPAIISLAHDKHFRSYLTTRELVSLPNFGTTFGMGLIVVTFMSGLGHFQGAMIGLVAAILGGVVSTRMMQFSTRKLYPKPTPEERAEMKRNQSEEEIGFKSEGKVLERFLNALLDGGKSGVDLGLAVIPGVLIISSFVMLLTYGPKDPTIGYQGLAGEGYPLLTMGAEKIGILFKFLFGFEHPELIAFPVTSLGSVGAALSLVPRFVSEGIVGGNEVAVFTAIGMCWSGYLSTHTAMYDALGYRQLTSKAILAQTVGGLSAGVMAHFIFLLISLF